MTPVPRARRACASASRYARVILALPRTLERISVLEDLAVAAEYSIDQLDKRIDDFHAVAQDLRRGPEPTALIPWPEADA